MNKIYRRLWSTARQCWVVASELTTPRGKASSTVGASALVLAMAMLPGAGMVSAHAYYYDACQSPSQHNCVPFLAEVEGSQPNTLVPGSRSYMMLGMSSYMQGSYSTLFGNWSRSVGDNNAVFGFDARAKQGGSAVFGARSEANGFGAVALGHYAYAFGDHSIAMGRSARTVGNDGGVSRIAIGGDAYAGTAGWTGAVALGGDARAEYDGLALGYKAQAKGFGSVALGRGAIATETYVVSVGNADRPRRVVYVDDGNVTMYSLDAVNGRQLLRVRETAEQGVSDAAAARAAADQALVNTKLVTQTSPGSVIRVGGENTGNVLTVSNTNGETRYLNGVRNATLSATSTDAVTGQQLFATNNTLSTVRATATAAKATAEQGLNRANALGLLISGGPTGGMQIGAGNTGSEISVRNKTGERRSITGLHDADLSAQSTAAVSGRQLFATNNLLANTTARLDAQAPALGNGAVAEGAGANAGTAVGQASKAFNNRSVALGNDARSGVDAAGNKLDTGHGSVALGGGTRSAESATAAGNGAQAVGKQSVAVGAQAKATGLLSTALGYGAQASTGQATALGRESAASGSYSTAVGNLSKATAESAVALGDRAEAGHYRSVALGRQSVTTGNDQVSVGNASLNLKRKIVNLQDGAVTSTSSEAVTGKQLNTTNTEVASVRTVATAAQTTANTAKTTADNALGKANTLGGLVSQIAADGNVRLGGENTGAVLDVRNKSNANRTLSGLRDGTVNGSSTEAVTGKQLFATNEKVQANEGVLAGHTRDLAAQSGRIADNRRDLDALRSEFEDFDPDLDGVVKFAADGSVDIAGGKLHGVAAGDISSAASTDAVNGGQLFASNERIASMEYGGRFFKIGTDESSEDAYAGWFGVAIGESAEASRVGEGGVAVGGFASALGTNSVALGRGSQVIQSATKGFALGASSSVDAEGGIALGADSRVTSSARGSVAIGEGSIADVAGTVSLGGEGLVRRITNVGRGLGLSDASTVAQLDDVLRTLGAGAGMDGNGNIIAPTYNVQGGTRNNVGDALAALDSAVVTADSRVDNLEGKLRSAFQDGPSVRADGLNQLVLAGANGSVLTNLADGRIAADSRDAVNGSQLFTAKQEIARNRSDLDDMKRRESNSGLGTIRSESSVLGDVDFVGARLTGVSDGRVSSTSSDVVTGAQLFGTNERVSNLETSGRVIAVSSKNEWNSHAKIGKDSVAVGEYSATSVGSEGGTAVGHYARADSKNSVAIGQSSWVSSSNEGGVAIGSRAKADGSQSLAIGERAWAFGDNSVAVGPGSEAMRSNEFSIGSYSNRRRLTHVANGIRSYDAATAGQLRESLEVLGGGSTLDAQGSVVAPTYRVQGEVQRSVGDALTSLDAAVVTNTTRTERVESQLRSVFQDSPSVRSDGLNQLTFAGANGMVLSNVANGAIAAGSRDAVNGGQLHSMQQQLNGRMDGLEQRIDGQPQAPQSRALTVAAADSAASSTPAATPAADAPTPPPPSSSDNKAVADAGNAPKSSPQPQADAPKPESPKPQVDTAELEKMLARANEYSDGISREVDARLDKMDKRFNRMAAMTSAQSAMAMNTAGLNTYNRLGAGVGYSDGESAMAVGYQRVLNDKGSATFSLNGAFTNSGERSMGVGVGIGW